MKSLDLLTGVCLFVTLMSSLPVYPAGIIPRELPSIAQADVSTGGLEPTKAQHERSTGDQFEGRNPEIQAINAYLTSLEPLTLDKNNVLPHINDVIEVIESLNKENLRSFFLGGTEMGYEGYEVFADCNDYNTLMNVLRNLVKASKSCTQDDVSFLMLVIEQETFDHQFLNRFSKQMLDQCRAFEMSLLKYRIDKSIGKLPDDIFGLIASLANVKLNILKENQSRERKEITIRDTAPPQNRDDLVKALRLVKFDDTNYRDFSLLLNRQFNSMLPADEDGKRIKMDRNDEMAKLEDFFRNDLVRPCENLVAKVMNVLNDSVMIYKRIFPDTLTSLLSELRKAEPELDYQLELYRVCRRVQLNSDKIWSTLSNMR